MAESSHCGPPDESYGLAPCHVPSHGSWGAQGGILQHFCALGKGVPSDL